MYYFNLQNLMFHKVRNYHCGPRHHFLSPELLKLLSNFPPMVPFHSCPLYSILSIASRVILLNINGLYYSSVWTLQCLPISLSVKAWILKVTHAVLHVTYLTSSSIVLPFAHPAPSTLSGPLLFRHTRHDFVSGSDHAVSMLFLNPYYLLPHFFRSYSNVIF